MNITGSCHCGEVQYQATVNPDKTMICHCSDCQQLSGTAFRTVVMSIPDGLTFTNGCVKEYIKTAQSGNKRAQGFCANCGSAIYATSVGEGEKVFGIRLGTVDQKAALIPKVQIWQRSSVNWLENISEIKSFSTVP